MEINIHVGVTGERNIQGILGLAAATSLTASAMTTPSPYRQVSDHQHVNEASTAYGVQMPVNVAKGELEGYIQMRRGIRTSGRTMVLDCP